MAKKLTKDGIKDIREESLDIPRKTPPVKEIVEEDLDLGKKAPAPEKKDYSSEHKSGSGFSFPEIKTRTKIIIIASVSLFLILLLANLFWFNMSVSGDKMRDNSTIVNNVQAPQVTVPINNNYTNQNNYTIENNIQIVLSDELVKDIITAVANNQSIINITNSTGSSNQTQQNTTASNSSSGSS